MIDPEPVEIDEVCRACRFGRGDDRACMLIDQGERQRLFAEGPCKLGDEIRREVGGIIRRRYPFARSQEEDVASDVLLQALDSDHLLLPGTIQHLPILRRRLKGVVRNAVIDVLRHHRLLARLRCGACSNFDKEEVPPGCTLRSLPDLGEGPRDNPWLGDKVDSRTDPRDLKPPCEAFTWRRPETHDIFDEEVPGMNPEGTPRERAVALLVQALDRLSKKDEAGMRVASALFWHYLRGKEVKTLAAEAGCSDKTIKRLLADGRERLLEIMQKEFAVENPGEVLA